MKKQEIDTLLQEAHAMDRGKITPGRVWEVTKNPDGSITRKQLDPENYRRIQAHHWKSSSESKRL